MKKILLIKYFFFLASLILGLTTVSAKDFVLVIDPGHGGHDPGAVGSFSKEKDINLRVSLAFGKLVENNCPDVKVIYTRKKDVFIPLSRRAEIANDAKADLFISVHTNAVDGNKTAKGASTWTLGLARTGANLEVAKRENSVILYEDDYKQKYAGFNPYSSESYIIFELIQDQYMEQSVSLASIIQKQFKSYAGRIDRGVHQAGFLVLKASAMPSVLVELGFISTPAEEKYLNTENGTKELSTSIYNAFLEYKKEWELKNSQSEVYNGEKTTSKSDNKYSEKGKTKSVNIKNETSQTSENKSGDNRKNSEPIFMVQIFTSSKKLPPSSSQFKGINDVEYYIDNGLYKYYCCKSSDYNYVYKKRCELTGKFNGAFIIAFKNGKRVDVNDAIEEYKKTKR